MANSDCIFCKIAAGEIPAYEIYADDNFIALLDIFPSHRGQALIIPREHAPSKFSAVDSDLLQKGFAVAQKVAKQIEERMPDVSRCQVVVEGMEIDHFHIKLYPAFNPEPTNHALTRGGERASDKELAKLQSQLRK